MLVIALTIGDQLLVVTTTVFESGINQEWMVKGNVWKKETVADIFGMLSKFASVSCHKDRVCSLLLNWWMQNDIVHGNPIQTNRMMVSGLTALFHKQPIPVRQHKWESIIN